MNGNYYVKKLKLKFKNRNVFIWSLTVLFFFMNLDLGSHFFLRQDAFERLPQGYELSNSVIGVGNKLINSPDLMLALFIYYCLVTFVTMRGISTYIFEFFFKKASYSYDALKEDDISVPRFPYDQDKLQLIIGLKHNEDDHSLVELPTWLVVPEKGLFQDFLIIGGKGTGKTASCMYPFTKQMIYFKAYEPEQKTGMLILDVKGNYTKQAVQMATDVNRQNDVIVINLSGKYRYNPLHKPSLKTQVIANRLRTILELFSTQHSDSYWLDKAEVLLNESIKLVRLYNKGYVTFVEIHKCVNNDEYLNEKIEYLQEIEDRNKMSREQKADFRTVKDYFLNEYKTLDTKISSVIKSEVTRMTYTFVSDPQILNTFCAPEDKLNFFGFDDLVDSGKIVVLDMNIAEFRNLSKIVAAYLKLDFQSAAMIRLTREGANTTRPLIFVSDEYQEYVTASDADFYAVSRESKCVNIVSSQSYSSLLKTLKSEEALQTILTNLTNKIWLRTDDKKTAEAAVAQCGVVDREDVSKSFTESFTPKQKYMFGRMDSANDQFSENMGVSIKTLEKFRVTTFTVKLPIFKAVAYLSSGERIMNPTVVHLQPYFEEIYQNLKGRPAPNVITHDAASPKIESLKDNYDFDSNKVTEESNTGSSAYEFDSKDTKDDFNDDFGFDAFGDAPRPKPKKEKKEEEFVPSYLDKEVEENLKTVEGIFDND